MCKAVRIRRSSRKSHEPSRRFARPLPKRSSCACVHSQPMPQRWEGLALKSGGSRLWRWRLEDWCSLARQAVYLDHERAIPQIGVARPERLTFVGVHNKQLASTAIFPPIPKIAAEHVVCGTVLQQGAGEHARRERVVGSRPHDGRRERAREKIDSIHGQAWLERNSPFRRLLEPVELIQALLRRLVPVFLSILVRPVRRLSVVQLLLLLPRLALSRDYPIDLVHHDGTPARIAEAPEPLPQLAGRQFRQVEMHLFVAE